MDRLVGAELGEPEDRVLDLSLFEQRDELIAEAGRGEVADEPDLDRAARQSHRMLVHPEAVAVLVADRAEDPRRIVDEREVVQDADSLLLEIGAPTERIDEPAVVVALQRKRHRVDREVAPEEVLPDRGVLDRRQRRRRVVELRPGRDDVDALAVAVDDHSGAELLVCAHPSAERVCERLRERDRVAFDGDVDVEVPLAEQDVPDGSAHQVDTLVRLGERGDGLEDRSEPLELRQLGGKGGTGSLDRRRGLPERFQHVAARDDPDEPVVPQNGDAVVAARQQALQLRERGLLGAGRHARAHDSPDRRVREPVRDRLVEILAADRSRELVPGGDEDAALAEALASDHRPGDGLVRRDRARRPRHHVAGPRRLPDGLFQTVDDQTVGLVECAPIDRGSRLCVATAAEHGRQCRGVELGHAAARHCEDPAVHLDEDYEPGTIGHVDELVRQVRDPLDVLPRGRGRHEHLDAGRLMRLERVEQRRQQLAFGLAERGVQEP